MKVRVYLKDPDGFYDGVNDSLKAWARTVEGVDEEDREALVERRTEAVWDAMRPWVTYKEYVMLEFDTEAKTVRVLTREESGQ